MKETKRHINPSYEILQARYYIDNLESKYANNQNKINLSIVHWKEFEELVAALFTLELECKVTPTRGSNDHGVDAIAIKKNETGFEEIIFQMKRYKGYVAPQAVRDLLGTMVDNKATTGVLVTTGSFGPSIYEFVQNKRIYLYNGPRLLLLFRKHGYSNFYIDSKKTYKSVTKPKSMNYKNKTATKQKHYSHNLYTSINTKDFLELQSKIKNVTNDTESFRKEVEDKILPLEENKSSLSSPTEPITVNIKQTAKNNPSQYTKKLDNKIQSKSKNDTSKLKKIFISIEIVIGYIILSYLNIGLGVFYLIIMYIAYIIYKKILRKNKKHK